MSSDKKERRGFFATLKSSKSSSPADKDTAVKRYSKRLKMMSFSPS